MKRVLCFVLAALMLVSINVFNGGTSFALYDMLLY